MSEIYSLIKNEHDFQQMKISDEVLKETLYKANLEVWGNNNRVVVIKAYTSYHHFLTWVNDQSIINVLYRTLSNRQKNNLYFLLVLDWDREKLSELMMEINRAEKNQNICRKYIIDTEEDIKRIPFFQKDTQGEQEVFNYDSKFKKIMLDFDVQKEDTDAQAKIQKIIEVYFEAPDFEDNNMEGKIKSILKGEE